MKKIFALSAIIILILPSIILPQSKYATSLKIISGKYFEERKIEIEVQKNNVEFYKFYKILEPHYSIPQIEIFNNGNLILIHSLEGVAEIYDTNSQLINNFEFYSLPPYNEQTLKFCKGKNSLGIIVSEDLQNYLKIVNSNGYVNKEMRLEDGSISGFAISEDDNFIAVSTYIWDEGEIENKSLIQNLITNQKISIQHLFNSGIFEKSTNNFIGYTNKSVFYFDINSKNIIWKKELSDQQLLLDVAYFNNNVFALYSSISVLSGSNWKYPNVKVTKIEKDGSEIITKILGEISVKPEFNIYKDKLIIKTGTNNLEVID